MYYSFRRIVILDEYTFRNVEILEKSRNIADNNNYTRVQPSGTAMLKQRLTSSQIFDWTFENTNNFNELYVQRYFSYNDFTLIFLRFIYHVLYQLK